MSTAEVIATVINFAALVFLGAQVMLARRALRETAEAQRQEWERQRKKATIEASVSTARYREGLKAVLPWNDRSPKEVAAFLKEANGDHTKLTAVREYLNHLEDIAVGIKQGVFDLDTISMLDGNRIIDVVASYAPYIESVREELHRPTTYEDIEDLAEMIKVHRQGLSTASDADTRSAQPTGHCVPDEERSSINDGGGVPQQSAATAPPGPNLIRLPASADLH
jgi:Domain of unknown function (DUF4760)